MPGASAPGLAPARRFLAATLGRRDLPLLVVAVAAPFLLTGADVGIAALLLSFLWALGLTTIAAPTGVSGTLAAVGPLAVWGGLLGLVALQGLLHVAAYQSKIVLTERVHLRLRLVLGQRLLPHAGAPPPLSRLTHLAAEVLPRASGCVFYGVQTLAFLIQATTLAVVMVMLAPGEALVGLLGFAVAAACVVGSGRRASRAAERMPASHLALQQTTVRAARNWLPLRALRLQGREWARYVGASRDHYRASVESYFFANLGLAVIPALAVVVIAATAAVRELVFGTPPATFAAFLYLFVRFQYLVANGSQLVGHLFTSGPHLREAVGLVAEVPPARIGHDDDGLALVRPSSPATSAEPRPGPPRIEANGLAFRWPGHDQVVLDDVAFTVPAGAQLGVTGANGSGKSTLLALLLGALAPTAGTLTLDGLPAAAWMARHAAAVGYVGPDAYLVAGSVRDNLRYGLDRACTDGELWAVVEQVGLADGAWAADGGLDRRIDEDGAGLSSGEKQKLALARALLRAPVLLVLDEPTANVDARSEGDVVDTLACLRGRCTVVLVAHEPRVLRHATLQLDLTAARGVEAPATR